MKAPRCCAPVLDAQKRASVCGKPATTMRVVEGMALSFCAGCAATLDAKAKATKGGPS